MADEFKFEVRGLSQNETPLPKSQLPPAPADVSQSANFNFAAKEQQGNTNNPPPPSPAARGIISASPAGDVATLLGAGIGYGAARTPAQIAQLQRKEMIKQAAQPPAPVQMRPGAQPAGATSAQLMQPGKMTSGDKWAAAIGGPGGATAEQAYENYRMRKTLAPGEVLLRSGLAVAPDVRTDLGQIEAEAVRRANPPPTASQNVMGALGAASRVLGPNKIIGPLAGAFAGHQAAQGAEQTGIDAALSGLSAAGGAMMASGVPALQIPGAGLAAAPYVGRAIAPEVADLLERFFPIRTGR